MNKKPLAALLLAGLTAASSITPAAALNPQTGAQLLSSGAVRTMMQHSLQMNNVSTAPPAQDGKSISFNAVERTVRSYNPTIQSLQRTITGISSTDIGKSIIAQYISFDSQMQGMKTQISTYNASAQSLRQKADAEQDAAIKASLLGLAQNMNANAEYLQRTIDASEAALGGQLHTAEEDAEDALDDQVLALKKKAENASNQLVSGAQEIYIAICTLQSNIEALDRGLAAIDRSIPVIKKQYEIGMASKLDLLNIENKRAATLSSKSSLQQQITSLENSLSIIMGNDAGNTVHAQALPGVSARDLAAMNYAKDLELVLKNSYTIWEKEDAVRVAGNDYEDNNTATLDAYKASQISRDAAKEEAKTTFRKLFDEVTEKNRLVSAAEEDLTLAEASFRVAEAKYQKGILSQIDYQNEKDSLKNAQMAVDTAKNNLFTAYNAYDWAKRGLM